MIYLVSKILDLDLKYQIVQGRGSEQGNSAKLLQKIK